MNCTIAALKFYIIAVNVLTTILGIGFIISLGLSSIHEEYLSFCIFGIVIGLIVCIVATFGCCGIRRSSSSLMWTYVALLTMLLVIQIAFISIFHYKDFVVLATEEVEQVWESYQEHSGKMVQLETHLNCCGLHSANDYAVANLTIPPSCYDKDDISNTSPYQTGCWDAIAELYVNIGKFIKISIWVLCGVQAISLTCACFLARSFRAHKEVRYLDH